MNLFSVLHKVYAKTDQPDITVQDIMALLEQLPNGDEPDTQ